MFYKFLIIGIISISLSNVTFSQLNKNSRITFFSSITFENTHRLSNAIESSEFEMNSGVLIGGEIVISNVEKPNKYGIGINYQLKNEFIGAKGNYTFWPLYIFNRYDIYESNNFNLGLYLSLGYNFFNASEDYKTSEGTEKGGLYYSFGFVNELFKSVQVRILYSTNYGKVDMLNTSFLIKNNFISIGVGYSF